MQVLRNKPTREEIEERRKRIRAQREKDTQEAQKNASMQFQLKAAAKLVAEQQTDEAVMVTIADLYDQWKAGVEYPANKIVSYGIRADGATQLYKVVQKHTSQADWLPDKQPALYTPIDFKDGVLIWRQPTGGHDAPRKGDERWWAGKVWVSGRDGNTSEPGTDEWWTEKN